MLLGLKPGIESSFCCCSVTKLCPPLQPHRLQRTRFPRPSPSPAVCPSSCPLNRWCYPTISSSVTLFLRLQFFPASEPFPMSWPFASGGQSIGTSASVLPMSIQGLYPLGFTGLISLLSKGLSRVFSSTTVWTISSHKWVAIDKISENMFLWIIERQLDKMY